MDLYASKKIARRLRGARGLLGASGARDAQSNGPLPEVFAMMATRETGPAKTGQSRRDGLHSRVGLDCAPAVAQPLVMRRRSRTEKK
jgi:hypothetical protein